MDNNMQKREEDRVRSAQVKKQRRRFRLFTVVALTLAWVLLLICVILLVWNRWEARKQKKEQDAIETVAEVQEILYSQEEVDALVAEALAEREAQADEAARLREEEVLGGIRGKLEDGVTVVETLRPYYPDDIVLVSNGLFHFVPISDALQHHDYIEENLNVLENGEFQYVEQGEVISHKGIDVSTFQGEIDWDRVAEDGVEFVFIRAIFRGYGSGKLVEDDTFEQNIEGALRAGIKVGVYVFSQAINEEELREETDLLLEKLAPYKIQCPVVFDVEKIANADGRMNRLSVEERTNLTIQFCKIMENAGYHPMIYHNMEMAALMLDLQQLEEYDKWFAYYNDNFYYPYKYKVWQYSEKGKVNGISTDVDMNISFEPLWEE